MAFDLGNGFSYALSNMRFYELILPLLAYTLAMVLYAIFIWKFYSFMAKRDIFSLDLKKSAKSNHRTFRKSVSVLAYALKYLIIFPVIVFVWFGVLALFIFFLSKTQSIETILLISITLVSSVRALSYYKEALATELAKLLPIAVLAVFIVEPTLFSIDTGFERIRQVSSLMYVLMNYLLFAIALEFTLRFLLAVKRKIAG